PVLGSLQAFRVHTAHRESLCDNVSGKTAALELGVDIRPGTHNDPKAKLFGKFEVLLQFGEVELTGRSLVIVPENVGVDGVQPRLSNLGEAITPKFRTNPWVRALHAEDERVYTAYREALRVIADDLRLREKQSLRTSRSSRQAPETTRDGCACGR